MAKRMSEAGLTAWRAELDIENGSYRRAAERLELANQLEPTRLRAERLGDAYLLGHDYVHARDAYFKVFTSTGSLEAEKGLGFALLGLGDLDAATRHLEHARDEYAKFERKPRLQWVSTLRGLAKIRAKRNDCEAAAKLRDAILAEVPDLPPANIEPCK
jgi:tetratricopeptide (TPR) repeat protein